MPKLKQGQASRIDDTPGQKRKRPRFGVRRESRRGSHAALDRSGRASYGLSVGDATGVNPKRRRRFALPAHSKTRTVRPQT